MPSLPSRKKFSKCIINIFQVYNVHGTYCFIHHLCNITIVLSDLESKDIFPHNNAQHCPFLHKSSGPFNPITFSSQFSESVVHHFAFFSMSVQADRTQKGNEHLEREREGRGGGERRRETDSVIAKDSRMEAVTNVFRWLQLLRPRHEYPLRKKVLMRALLHARRGASRSYAKSI